MRTLARDAHAATLALGGVVQALAVDVVALTPRVPEMRTLARDAGTATLALGGVLAVDVVTLACARLARDAGAATLALDGLG